MSITESHFTVVHRDLKTGLYKGYFLANPIINAVAPTIKELYQKLEQSAEQLRKEVLNNYGRS